MGDDSSSFDHLVPDWWWFRDAHSCTDGKIRVTGSIASRAGVSVESIRVSCDGELLRFKLTEPAAEAKSRFWYLPADCVRGVEIEYSVTGRGQESRIELSSSTDRSGRVFPFMQVHDWEGRRPVPPVANIERVSGVGATPYNYFCNGATDFVRFSNIASSYGVDFMSPRTTVLDWGAGCGRLSRWFSDKTAVRLFGVDVDRENVRWCKDNLAGAEYGVVGLYPPTEFDPDSFDLIFANSVLTHLTRPTMVSWLQEIRRIGRPGSLALLSFHGNFSNAYFVSRSLEMSSKILSDGFYDKQVGMEMVGVLSDPHYYRQTFMADEFAVNIFRQCGFEVLDIIVGYVSRCQNLAVLRI